MIQWGERAWRSDGGGVALVRKLGASSRRVSASEDVRFCSDQVDTQVKTQEVQWHDRREKSYGDTTYCCHSQVYDACLEEFENLIWRH